MDKFAIKLIRASSYFLCDWFGDYIINVIVKTKFLTKIGLNKSMKYYDSLFHSKLDLPCWFVVNGDMHDANLWHASMLKQFEISKLCGYDQQE